MVLQPPWHISIHMASVFQFFLAKDTYENAKSGIESLFSFQIDGDVGVDPNAMTLWVSQPTFGLPSKVILFTYAFSTHDVS